MSTTAATLKEKAPNNLLINAWLVVLVEKGGKKRATSGPHHVWGDILLYLHSD